MTVVTDLRNDPIALAAFIRNWRYDPIVQGKPYGLRFVTSKGDVRCSRCFASERSATAALNRTVR